MTPGAPGQAPVIDYSTPYEGPYSNESVLERYLSGGIDLGSITNLIAAGLILPSVLGLIAGAPKPPTVKRPVYAPLPPTNWGSIEPLGTFGVNPGEIIGPAQEPFYQTTSPVQSKYFYGRRPLIQTRDQIRPTLQDRTLAPVTPFGLQQMQQSYDLNQVLNQINQAPLDPNFVGYAQYPTAGYQPVIPPG